jgi:hypothetical protein
VMVFGAFQNQTQITYLMVILILYDCCVVFFAVHCGADVYQVPAWPMQSSIIVFTGWHPLISNITHSPGLYWWSGLRLRCGLVQSHVTRAN